MADDLLGRIRVEMQERMQALYPTVRESERLLADLRVLEGEHGVADELPGTACALRTPETQNPPALHAIEPAAPADAEPVDVAVAVEPAPAVAPVAERTESAHTRPLVSPKVLRLMGNVGTPVGGASRPRSS